MAKEKEIPAEEVLDEEAPCGSVQATARTMFLATIGAMAWAQEEIGDLMVKLVERGEIARAEGQKVVGDVMDKRKEDAKKAEAELDKRTQEILNRMNVPTKSDIDGLSAKVTALSKKVDELKSQ